MELRMAPNRKARMTNHDDQGREQAPAPQGKFGGAPYDWRKPTTARVRARLWNPEDPRVVVPKAFGWGWDVNFYWLTHPAQLVRSRRNR